MENKIILASFPNEGIFNIIYINKNNEVQKEEIYQPVFNYKVIPPDIIQLVSPNYNTTLTFKITSVYVRSNGMDTPLGGTTISESLAFLSSGFKKAGGSAIPTLEPVIVSFEQNKSYKSGNAIVREGAIYLAKVDFVSGTSFDTADWNKVSNSVIEFEDGLDAKLDKTDDPDKMYGTDAVGNQKEYDVDGFEVVSNKTIEIRDADHADDTKYPTELAVRKQLNSLFDEFHPNKVEITKVENRIYGTDFDGNQTTYDKDELGQVDTVNGISPDENKNVQTTYVYNTEEEFEDDENNIPVGAMVIKLYE
jgi:hypothetical protein